MADIASNEVVRGIALRVTQFGAVGGDVTKDTAAFQAALAAGAVLGRPVVVPRLAIPYLLNAALSVDLSKTTLQGDGAILDFSALGAAKALTINSTQGYPALDIASRWIGGFQVRGASVAGSSGVYVGSSTSTFLRQIEVRDLIVYRFDKNIEFGNNSYRTRFLHCTSNEPVNHHVYYPSGLSNSGEAMIFDHCLFEPSTAVELLLYDGQFAFYSCSFLNCSIHARGQAHVSIFGGNLESPSYAGSGYRYVKVEDTAYVELNGANITLANPGGAGFTMAPIYCSVTEGGGVALRGVKIPQDSWLKPEVTDGVRVFVAGGGRVQVEGAHLFNSFGARDFHALAESCNVIHNGGAELNSTAGWSTTQTGTGGVFQAAAAALKNGVYGFSLTVNTGSTLEAWQEFPVVPGRAVLVSMWYQMRAWSNNLRLEFYTKAGALISTSTYAISNAAPADAVTIGPWTSDAGKVAALAPKGASYARLVVAGTSASAMYFDDVIVNVV